MSDDKFLLASRNPGRRWYQYRLRSLLILVALSAIPCSWFAVKLQREAASLTFIFRTEDKGGMVPPGSKSNPPSVVSVRARAGAALGEEWCRSAGPSTVPFTVMEILDKDHAKIRVGVGLNYTLWFDGDRQDLKTYHATTDNQVVVLATGGTLAASTPTIDGGEAYTLSISDPSK